VTTSITERIVNDLKTAMKQGENDKRDVIRLLRAAFKNREIELRHGLDDDEAIEVILAQIKQRRDSIDAYDNAGRSDLADRERLELRILLEYLPNELKPIDEAELEQIVVAKVQELKLDGPSDMRTLMPALIEATEGRADNRLLSTLAAAELRKRASSA
jgi:uncharacterized protein